MQAYIDRIIETKNQIDSIYDLMARCYDLIISEINDEGLFIGEYVVENDEANENNPNIKNLISFEANIHSILKQNNADIESCFNEIEKLIKKVDIELEPYGSEKFNKLTPIYFLIVAIDRYSKNINDCQFSNGPLNHCYIEKSLIYFKPCKSLIDDAAEELKFSGYITDNTISNCLNNITIVKNDIFSDGKKPTKIFSLYLDEKEARIMSSGKKINVAIIPFNGFEITNISKEKGALFTVKYDYDYAKVYSKRAICLLDIAIDKEANIIVFPEYICNEEIQNNISKHLEAIRETQPDRLKQLLFVVAGTGWIEGNNISKIYDKSGVLIGSHYKLTKYYHRKIPEDHDNQLTKYHDQLTENLQFPGKESLAIDVKGVGRFMPAICRDISFGNYMYPLFDAFKPFTILIPAWSSSVNIGFNSQCCDLAAKYHMSSILCNSCEPLKSDENMQFRKENNLIVTPYKNYKENHSHITGKVKMIERTLNCDFDCKDKACIFLITMDYSVESVREGEIVKKCDQMRTEIN